MRLLAWLAAFAGLVVAVVLLTRSGEIGVVATPEPTQHEERGAAGEGERSRDGAIAPAPRDPERSTPSSTAAARPASPPAADEPVAAQPTGSVVLRAYDDGTRAWLVDFTWTAVGTVRGLEPRGGATGDAARLTVPLRTPLAVVLEREGYFASLPVDVSLHTDAFREVHVPLVPRPTSDKVRVVARDEFGQPVARLVVRCRARGVDREARKAFADVYEMLSVADSGVHELPPPPEGWCRLALVPDLPVSDPRILQSQALEFRRVRERAKEHELVFARGGRVIVEGPETLEAVRLLDANGKGMGVAMVPDPTREDARVWRSAEALAAGDFAVGYGMSGRDQTRAFRLVAGQELRLLLP